MNFIYSDKQSVTCDIIQYAICHSVSGLVANLELWERSEVLFPSFPVPSPPLFGVIKCNDFPMNQLTRLCISLQACFGNACITVSPCPDIINIRGNGACPLDYTTAQCTYHYFTRKRRVDSEQYRKYFHVFACLFGANSTNASTTRNSWNFISVNGTQLTDVSSSYKYTQRFTTVYESGSVTLSLIFTTEHIMITRQTGAVCRNTAYVVYRVTSKIVIKFATLA